MKVYLDTSIYCRPFDDQTQPKIFLETQAIAIILQMVAMKSIELVNSSVLEYENSRNPDPVKQAAMNRYLQTSAYKQLVDEAIRQRAKELEHNGVKAMDALHVACAEASGSDYLITCDKRLINRCSSLSLQVVNPIDFVLETETNGQDQN
ncbi:MAG: PIN domain-containing protein [Cyanobacteria bacterium P01_C01_bin.121]